MKAAGDNRWGHRDATAMRISSAIDLRRAIASAE
jgi:hypothetical protein